MALDVEGTLAVVGIMVVAAFLAHIGFRLWRLPEVLILIGLGVLLGPFWGIVDIDLFRTVAPLVATIAIIVILFDGGLEMQVAELRTAAADGAVLAVVVFSATAALCAAIAVVVLGMTLPIATLLGMAFGGAGVVIVVPLIQQLGVEERSVTVVSVEAAISDVFVIVGIYGLSTAIAVGHADPTSIAGRLVLVFAIGIVAGLAAGYGWARLLGTGHLKGYQYVLTLAALFLVHVAVEHLGGSGPLAVLAFGLVVGNSNRTREFVAARTFGHARPQTQQVPVFGKALVNFHHEVIFFIRAFFFVGLGVTLDIALFRQPNFLLAGALLALAVGAARAGGVLLLARRYPAWDRTCIALMFPLGLAAAALSLVPFQRFGIEGTERFGSYAAVVIVFTNILSSLLVYVVSLPPIRSRLKQWTPPGPAPDDA